MAGRLGNERQTMQNLKILKIDPLRDLLFVKGSLPGPNGSFVRVTGLLLILLIILLLIINIINIIINTFFYYYYYLFIY